MIGKLIIVEGTDCSGKESQTNLLLEELNKQNIPVKKFSFPNYNSPTGKIIGGPYLGKKSICDGWFDEGATNVDYKVSSLYYAADRLYNIKEIQDNLDNGINVILDRYVYSNMSHQGCKIIESKERFELYKWIEELEFNLLKLPIPDIRIFLHMPTDKSIILKVNRIEEADQHESDTNYLRRAENAYLEIVKEYDFETIECSINDDIRTIEDINNQLNKYVIEKLNS